MGIKVQREGGQEPGDVRVDRSKESGRQELESGQVVERRERGRTLGRGGLEARTCWVVRAEGSCN